MNGTSSVATVWSDLVYAARALARARAFTLVCVVSLGIGMALVLAIPYWGRVLRTPPAGVDTEGLVEVVTTTRGTRAGGSEWSYPDYEDLRGSDTGIAVSGWKGGHNTIAIETEAGPRTRSVPVLYVSANYFRTIGVPLARGAGFDASADNPSAAEPVVILGYDYWKRHLAADPDILGKSVTLDAVPHVVVGVAQEHFSGHMGYHGRQLFLPLGRYGPLRTDRRVRTDRGHEWLYIAGRRPPGVSLAQASAAVAAVTARLATEYPATNGLKPGIAVAYDPLGYGNEFRIVQALFFTLTGGVLIVVCLNVSGMMLVRSALRERELSIRQAIGATRARLARHVLSEAVVLAGLGAILGSIILLNAPPLVSWWAGRPLPYEVQQALKLEPSMFALGAALCLVASLVFGWLPALRFSRPVIISSLKDDAGVGGVQAGRMHRWAAALQVAIAVPLLILCGITLDRVRATATADLGFASDLVYAAPLNFDRLADERVASQIQTARANLERASGVAAATVADGLPLDFKGRQARVSLPAEDDKAARGVHVQTTRVAEGYLETLGIPLLIGRGFTHEDSAGGERVTVISKSLADHLAPGAPAAVLGRQLKFGTDEKSEHTVTVVGVVRDFPAWQMDAPRAQLLLPLAQHPSPRVFLIARRADGEEPMKARMALETTVRDLGPDVDRTVPSSNGESYARLITGVWLRENSVRVFLERSAILGGVGSVILILAALGIYGVVGLMVATRTREIAVRSALGASHRTLVGMILFDVVKLVLPGVGFGILITLAIVRLKGDNMGIRLSDAEPLAYVFGAALAVLVAVLASLTHARRAAAVQPMVAMRST